MGNIELTKKALAAEAEGKKTAYQVRLAATQADLAAKAAARAAVAKAALDKAALVKATAAKAAVATKPATINPAYAKAAQQAACGKGTNCWNFRNYSPKDCLKGTKCYYYTN